MAKLSAADKLVADWLAEEVRRYGPLNQAQVRDLAGKVTANADAGKRVKGNRMLAFGLNSIANEMQPDEKVTGAVPWWKRF
jgi:hypothetical protein